MLKRNLTLALAVPAALCVGLANAGEITMYNAPAFAGPALTLNRANIDLQGTGFYDSVSSIQVHSGNWQVCSQPEFRGDCRVLAPGRYPTLGVELNHRIESVRELAPVARSPYDNSYAEYRPGPRLGAVELYAAPGFRGPSTRLNRNARDLDLRGMDDRVSSLVVNEGRWELCTQPNFDGVCREFGPGEYARLGRLEDRVSSLRRVG